MDNNGVGGAVAAISGAVDTLLSADLSGLDRAGLTGLIRELEVQRRRLDAVDQAVIAEAEQRGVCHEYCERTTVSWLVGLLRIAPGEAKARVAAAADLGPRRGLTGERLPAIFEHLAAAQAQGVLSAAQARVITTMIDRLPPEVAAEHAITVEVGLLEAARGANPHQLARAATHLAAVLDPDGLEPAERRQHRHRDLSLVARPDGSGVLTGTLTAPGAAIWRTLLDALSPPVPGPNGEPDPRSAGQRRHDALLTIGQRALRTGDLPAAGGVPVTILATISADQLITQTGYAVSQHGDPISIPALLQLATEAELIPVVLNQTGGVLGYGRTRRLASPAQRLALAARDGGCSFPGCSMPAAWTEIHHIKPWAEGGATDLNNLTPLCSYNHQHHLDQGWTCHITNGTPWWKPPTWIDPDQTPIRNTVHHPQSLLAAAKHLIDNPGADTSASTRTAPAQPRPSPSVSV